MNIYFEPVNVNQWNIFEKVSGVGHIEPFLATKSMEEGDIVLLNVGCQNRSYESGIYSFGTIVKGPYILSNSPEDYCNNKRTVDVRIDYICYGKPFITHEESKSFLKQYRTVHKIDPSHYSQIMKTIEAAVGKV